MRTPAIDDMWLVVRALHRDLDAILDRIARLEETLLPLLGDDDELPGRRRVVRLPAGAADTEPPGWVSPSAEPGPRSDRAWRSASGS